MITLYLRFRSRPRLFAARWWWWARSNRFRAGVLLAVFWWLLCMVSGNAWLIATAHADDYTPALMTGLADVTDDQGVPAARLGSLPIDHGDVIHPQKMMAAMFLDFIWSGHVGIVSIAITFIKFLLGFEWITWLTEPLNGIAEKIQGLFGQSQWIPFALCVTAAVAGLGIWVGRRSAGVVNIMTSVLCVALLGGVLSNPVTLVTGDDGVMSKAKQAGTEFAVALASDTASTDSSATDGLSGQVVSELVTLFMRQPLQTISFGRPLTGDCDNVFTEKAKADNTSVDDVRKAVGSCDDLAKLVSGEPSFLGVSTAAVLGLGSTVLMLFACAFGLLLFAAALYMMWSAISLLVALFVNALPSVGRRWLWKSFLQIFAAAGSLIASVIALSVYLNVLASVMRATAKIGLVMQMVVVDILLVVSLFMLWRMRKSMKEAANRAGEKMAALGTGSAAKSAKPRSLPIGSMMNAVTSMKLASAASGAGAVAGATPAATGTVRQLGSGRIKKPGEEDIPTIPLTMESRGGRPATAGAIGGSTMGALPAGGPDRAQPARGALPPTPSGSAGVLASLDGPKKPAGGGAARRAIGGATQGAATALLAAGTGGTSAAASVVAKKAAQGAAVNVVAGAANRTDRSAGLRPEPVPQGARGRAAGAASAEQSWTPTRIEVDSSGIGRIKPRASDISVQPTAVRMHARPVR